jgi:methyl-accepting chemotaxis protein
LGQNPFAQGHDPVIHLYNHLTAGWEPSTRRLLTHMDVVTHENYETFWDPERGILQSQEALDRLAKPASNPLGRALRIGVLGRDDSAFWTPVKEGALAAAEKLRPLGCTVEWIVPEEAMKNNNFSARVYVQCMENLVAQGANAIATIVTDTDLVSAINRMVRAGIPVATLNGEPSSFRGLIFMITEQASRLMRMSGLLTKTVGETTGMTSHIQNAVSQIAEGALSQNQEMERTEENLESLLSTIDRVSKESEESARSAETTAQAVETGTEAMDKTLIGIQSIEQSVGQTWQTVDELAGKSERIDAVVDLITDIASRVNVLALNASIEAARAGEAGRGFGVVAAEVGKLAKNTADATREATKLIRTVKMGIGSARESMVRGLEVVRESAVLTDETKLSLEAIRHSIHENRDRIKQIVASITGMQEFSHSVGDAMRHVASITTENTHAVEEVDSATRKLNTESQEMAKLAQSLETMASGEQEMLARFNISEESNGKV